MTVCVFQVTLSGLTQVVFEINMEATKKRHVIKRLSQRKLVPNEQGKAEVIKNYYKKMEAKCYNRFDFRLVTMKARLFKKWIKLSSG